MRDLRFADIIWRCFMKKITFILLIFGFIFSSYSSGYQIEQSSQEERESCPFLYFLVVDKNTGMLRDILRNIRMSPNVSLEGCRGEEFYDGLPENSTLLHVAAHLEGSYNIYQALKQYGASEAAKDENGNTPPDIQAMMRKKRLGR